MYQRSAESSLIADLATLEATSLRYFASLSGFPFNHNYNNNNDMKGSKIISHQGITIFYI